MAEAAAPRPQQRHYIVFRLALLKEPPAAFASNDLDQLFADVTWDRTQLKYVHLPPNQEGPRIGLVGRSVRCLAGLERGRASQHDSLFVYSFARDDVSRDWPGPRVYPADLRILHPKRLSEAAPLDKLDILAGQESEAYCDPVAVPSEELQQALRFARESLLSTLRPGPEEAAPNSSESLEAVRKWWVRYRLQDCVPNDFPPRHVAILSGAISPPPEDQFLVSLFRSIGVGVLNRAARKMRYSQRMSALLEEYVRLPIAPSVRATLWAYIICGFSPDEFKQECNRAAEFLRRLADETITSKAWEAPMLRALQLAAESDAGLADVFRRVSRAPRPLEDIARWAWSLHFDTLQAEPELAVTVQPAPTPHQAENIALAAPLQLPEFDRWFLSFSVSSVQELEGVVAEIRAAFASTQVALANLNTADSLLEAMKLLGGLQLNMVRWLKALPGVQQLEQDLPTAREAFARARDALGAQLSTLLSSPGALFPDDLEHITRLAPELPRLEMLPSWVFEQPRVGDDAGGGTPSVSNLASPIVRKRLDAALRMLAEYQMPLPAAATNISAPPPEADDSSHLESELRRILELEHSLQSVRPEHVSWVKAALASGEEPISIRRAVDRLEAMRDDLHSETFAHAIKYVVESGAADNRDQRYRAVRNALDEIVKLFGSDGAKPLPWDHIRKLISKAERNPAQLQHRVAIDHNFVSVPAARATPSFHRSATETWGSVAVPLTIETQEPGDYQLVLDIEERSGHRDAWPAEWPSITPSSLQISARDWRDVPDRRGIWAYSFSLSVPLREPRARSKLELDATARDKLNGSVLSPTKRLTWDSIRSDITIPVVNWSEDCNPEFVTLHPVGPQRDHEQMSDRVRQGGSFAVLAPRRFGKTTLVRYLETLGESLPVLVIPHRACTAYLQGRSIDYERLWRDISDDLSQRLGAGIRFPLQGQLPAPGAFDLARSAAARSKKESILLLIDESQLFFPRDERCELGNRLKDLLEISWGTVSTGLARVIIGFVGLPGLQERAGHNLMGRLQPIYRPDIDEQDLNRVIRKVTSDSIQTTREARLEIARFSPNLLVLRDVVRRLVQHVRDASRNWASIQDVRDVTERFKQEVRSHPEMSAIGVRDVFNNADTVDQWEPNACFPIAVALAKVGYGRRSLAEPELVAHAVDVIRDWLVAINEGESLQRVTIDTERIENQLDALRDRGIVQDSRFTSELLEAWLEGVARNPPVTEETFRQALVAAAARRLRRPQGMEPRGGGKQAKIFVFQTQRKDSDFAWREVRFGDQDARRRFVETSEVLTRLLRGRNRREIGSDYVFEFEDMGLVDHETEVGAQVYRWIPGTDLSQHCGKLTAGVVAELGLKLGTAVDWLHRNNILHRDIRPPNVILRDEDSAPVLIDFGLARFADSAMSTRMAGEFAAPETCAVDPRWTRASDVYGLCTTLRKLLKPEKEALGLVNVLDRGVAQDPEKRPSAAEIRDELEQICRQAQVLERRQEVGSELERLVLADTRHEWFRKIFLKFKPQLESVELGFVPDPVSRAAVVADFINQLLEAGTRHSGRQVNFGKAKAGLVPELAGEEIAILHTLRNWKNHGDTDSDAKLRKTKGLQASVSQAVRQVAQYLGLNNLPELADRLLPLK